MRTVFRKIGLALSAAAVLFTAVCLPLHYHEDQAQHSQSSHCSICHFSKEGKASGVAAAFQGPPCAPSEGTVSVVQADPLLVLLTGQVPQRAPPAALS
ncbi:MAG TPA: hypothetical protein VLJ37_10330 [bacterium]|nr:hypothetical protein [bacterium]